MIPILFDRFETSFTSNGIGRLSECISCKVTEERNGIYEVEFEYPITGKFYSYLIDPNGVTIGVIHDDYHDVQPFDVYAYSAPIDGVVTFYAHHISYRLSRIVVTPFTATSPASAMSMIEIKSVNNNPFIFWTDKASGGTLTVDVPHDVRSLLFGEEGSILDAFGKGEYQFDKFTVKLYANRGLKTDVTIRYGKNMNDVMKEFDSSEIYNVVAPYWKGNDPNTNEEIVIYLPEVFIGVVASSGERKNWTDQNNNQMEDGNGNPIDFGGSLFSPVPLDMTSFFDEMPATDELRQAAYEYLTYNKPWVPSETITVDFVQLWQTDEYANVAALQRVSLCDTVSVYYPELGIIASDQKVVKVVYDVLLERYSEMELGESSKSFSENISSDINADIDSYLKSKLNNVPTISMMETMIQHANDLITGGLGGYVVFNLNANGEPQEILIMDTPDMNTAVHVIRMNRNGIGFSNNGYNGPYRSAWTIDGVFNADFITAGTMLANRILGGTLTLGGSNNGNGVLQLLDANGNLIGNLDNTGLTINSTKLYTRYGSESYASMPNPSGRRYPAYKRKALMDSGSFNVYAIQVKDASGADISPVESLAGQFFGCAQGVNIESGGHIQFNINGNSPSGGGVYTNGGINIGYSVDESRTDRSQNVEFLGSYFINLGKFSGSYNSVICWEDRATSGDSWYIHTTGTTFSISRATNPASVSDLNTTMYSDGGTSLFRLNAASLKIDGSIYATNLKSRLVHTEDYDKRLLYCYETPSPTFGDIGEGAIGDDGLSYIWLDAIFNETVSTDLSYQVFLQKYGTGDCWVKERKANCFIVEGTPGLEFGWELKAKQKGFDQYRLEVISDEVPFGDTDYGELALEHITELRKEREGA